MHLVIYYYICVDNCYLVYCCSNTHWWNSLHYAFIIYALWSHTRTVVRQCCKPVRATMQVNGEAQNLTPHDAQTPYAGIIKTGRGDYVVDLYTSRSAQGFRFRTCVTLSAKLHTKRCYFFGGSCNSLQRRPLDGFWRKIRQNSRFCARMCLFGVANIRSNI